MHIRIRMETLNLNSPKRYTVLSRLKPHGLLSGMGFTVRKSCIPDYSPWAIIRNRGWAINRNAHLCTYAYIVFYVHVHAPPFFFNIRIAHTRTPCSLLVNETLNAHFPFVSPTSKAFKALHTLLPLFFSILSITKFSQGITATSLQLSI